MSPERRRAMEMGSRTQGAMEMSNGIGEYVEWRKG
jgi:hypothetical protein